MIDIEFEYIIIFIIIIVLIITYIKLNNNNYNDTSEGMDGNIGESGWEITTLEKEGVGNVAYFDNNSTTLIYDKRVVDELINWSSTGNPSNTLHIMGRDANKKIEACRNSISKLLDVESDEIYFTSNATESNNIAIQGVILDALKRNIDNNILTVVTSSCEHPSVLNVCQEMVRKYGIDLVLLPPYIDDENSELYGCVDISNLKEIMRSRNVILVSIMHGNNETGALNDIIKIGKIVKKHGSIFHCDVTQSIGKYKIYPKRYNISLMSFSGHKLHGPKGVGCLYIDNNINIDPLMFGGSQERGIRPGTENIANIAGMTMALNIIHENREQKNNDLLDKRRYIINELYKFTNIQVIGPSEKYILPNTLYVIFNDIKTCNVIFAQTLGKNNICVSIGSACKKTGMSHVLESLKVCNSKRDKVIRISLSDYTTMEECKKLIDVIRNFV